MICAAAFLNAYSQADFFGKLIFLGLFVLSIISWVILVHKIKLARKLHNFNVSFENIIKTKKDQLLFFNFQSDGSYPYYIIYKSLKEKTLEILNKNNFYTKEKSEQVYISQADINLLEAQVDVEISDQKKKLEKNLFLLPTIVTLGPFLGLLGTVWGILITFSSLQTHSLVSNNETVLSGLSMALSTTVIGLMVAIPPLIAYNYLKTKIKDATTDMQNFSHRLISTIEIQYRKVDQA